MYHRTWFFLLFVYNWLAHDEETWIELIQLYIAYITLDEVSFEALTLEL
jgi:hypothetical protein